MPHLLIHCFSIAFSITFVYHIDNANNNYFVSIMITYICYYVNNNLQKRGETMFNIDVRNAIKNAGLFGYEVAAALHISETSFSRAIARSELTDSRKEQIFKAIEEIAKGKKTAP